MLRKEKHPPKTGLKTRDVVFWRYILPYFLSGCASVYSANKSEIPSSNIPSIPPITSTKNLNLAPINHSISLPLATENQQLLQESWLIYRQRFIQGDGRVIDREGGDRSTSEAQAYAMLRAVFANDPDTFATTLNWAESNLQRRGNPTINIDKQSNDRLWVWQWGKDISGKWQVLDANFASDADMDAITALILASRRWNRPEYLSLAVQKLEDLWELSTIISSTGKRYLLPGPKIAFQIEPSILQLNPSYLAPYSFRLFAQIDKKHDWLSLVDSSYEVIEKSSQISAVGLPSDWVLLNTKTEKFQSLPEFSITQTKYSFDSYRIWWRLALDAAWFNEPKALHLLQTKLVYFQQQWRSQAKIPAQIDLEGKAIVNYEATSQYAMLYIALRLIDPVTAQEILEKKLLPPYKNGIWDNDKAYYSQNLAWLGLVPPTIINSQILTQSGLKKNNF